MMIPPDGTTTLYRPATTAQVMAIASRQWQSFGNESLLEGYFYPMLHHGYAQLVARQWNARIYGEGFVLCCHVESGWLAQYQPCTIATANQLEYRIPATQLRDFNLALRGQIKSIGCYRQTGQPVTYDDTGSRFKPACHNTHANHAIRLDSNDKLIRNPTRGDVRLTDTASGWR